MNELEWVTSRMHVAHCAVTCECVKHSHPKHAHTSPPFAALSCIYTHKHSNVCPPRAGRLEAYFCARNQFCARSKSYSRFKKTNDV